MDETDATSSSSTKLNGNKNQPTDAIKSALNSAPPESPPMSASEYSDSDDLDERNSSLTTVCSSLPLTARIESCAIMNTESSMDCATNLDQINCATSPMQVTSPPQPDCPPATDKDR